jgi:hypothetical protein
MEEYSMSMEEHLMWMEEHSMSMEEHSMWMEEHSMSIHEEQDGHHRLIPSHYQDRPEAFVVYTHLISHNQDTDEEHLLQCVQIFQYISI